MEMQMGTTQLQEMALGGWGGVCIGSLSLHSQGR